MHEFTKVEMFIAAEPGQSDNILEQIRTDQEKFFQSLDLHFQVLDMPPHDLGAPAYRKYDIEAWMPGRNIYGVVLFIFLLLFFKTCTCRRNIQLFQLYRFPVAQIEHTV